VRPDLELEVYLAALPAVRAPAFGVATFGSAAALPLTSIKNHLDVHVVSKSIEQIFVQAHVSPRDEKEMSGHVSLSRPSDEISRSCLPHRPRNGRHM